MLKDRCLMAVDIVMPNLGFDTQSGRLIEWLKQPGDPVRRGDILAVVESDKANVELESIADGVLLELLIPADTEVPVGEVIARVGARDEVRSAAPVASTPVATTTVSSGAAATLPEISPVARRLAE